MIFRFSNNSGYQTINNFLPSPLLVSLSFFISYMTVESHKDLCLGHSCSLCTFYHSLVGLQYGDVEAQKHGCTDGSGV